MLFAEFFDEGGIGEIGLGNELFGRSKVFFFFPVNGNLRFGELLLALRFFRVQLWSSGGHGGNSPWKKIRLFATARNGVTRAHSFLNWNELACQK
jgi:hypothetical protein